MSGSTGTGAPFPPPAPTTLQVTIKSYLYDQYTDDDALQTFVIAYNVMQWWILDWWNEVGLPYWPGLTDKLLDWIGAGLYGFPRPTLSFAQTTAFGGYGSAFYGQIAYAEEVQISNSTLVPVNDDIYQRILTWHLYIGDGWQFNTRWLKQRVHRFLNGANGILPIQDNTADVSIISIGEGEIEIRVQPGPIATILTYAIMDGVLALPQQYAFSIANLPALGSVPPTTNIVITRQDNKPIDHFSELRPWFQSGVRPGAVVTFNPPVNRIAMTRQEQPREGRAHTKLPSIFNPALQTIAVRRYAITRQEQPQQPSASHGINVRSGQPVTFFTIKSGNIIDPHGNTWLAKGVNVLDTDISNVSRALLNAELPDINCVRLACGGDAGPPPAATGFQAAQSNATIQAFVNDITNNGRGPMVVVIENHDASGQAAYTGSLLTSEQTWYQGLAVLFRNNPWVMFGTMNEPGGGAVSAQHQATYNTIRTTKNNTLIACCISGGWDYPDDASVYTTMHGAFLDGHMYNWQPYSGSSTFGPPCADPTNQTQVNAGIANYIANLSAFASTLDGAILVLLLEMGFLDYAHDPTIDVHGANGTNQVVIGCLTTGLTSGRGAAVWLWVGVYAFGNAATDLYDEGSGTLTDHGAVVLAHT